MTQPLHFLSLGEALIDVVQQGESTTEHVGGSLLNVGCGLARLGWNSTIAAWIGDDPRGEAIVEWINAAGATLAAGSMAAVRTPVAFAELDEAGKATYTFDLAWDVPELDLGGFAHIHTGSIAATLEPGGAKVVDAVRSAVGTVSYDPNVRPAIMGEPSLVIGRVEDLVAASDVVKASDEDAAWLYPGRELADIAAHWLGLGPALVVFTRGGDGASAALADGLMHDVEPRMVEVGDTVGAGDSFMAGLLSALADLRFIGGPDAAMRLRRATWAEVQPALDRAIATSAITVGRRGAYGPSRAEVDELIA